MRVNRIQYIAWAVRARDLWRLERELENHHFVVWTDLDANRGKRLHMRIRGAE